MATNAPAIGAMLLQPNDLAATFDSLQIDAAASGTVDNRREAATWSTVPDSPGRSVIRGRVTGCELTAVPSDAGLQALTAHDGLLSVTTRVSHYVSPAAAESARDAIAKAVRAGHGPAGPDRVILGPTQTAQPDDQQALRFERAYANPTAPEPHPVTLGFSIPPRTWLERWSLMHHGALLGAVSIRYVGMPPDQEAMLALEELLLHRMLSAPAATSSSQLWMLDDDTVAGRFDLAFEASSPALHAATRDALIDIDAVLPGDPVRIRVVRSPTMGEHNAGGLTKADGSVLLYLRLENLDLVPLLLKSILAHELHHSVRNRRGTGREDLNSLLGTMVLEGLGTVFQLEVCPEIPIRYAEALDPATEAELWRKAQPELRNPLGPLAAEWFYGRGQAPRWAGYTIGTHIVQVYLAAHAGRTAADLIAIDTETILHESRYAP